MNAQVGWMMLTQSHTNFAPIHPSTARNTGHAVCTNQFTTALIAILIPAHTASTAVLNQPMRLYARMNAPMSRPIAAMIATIGQFTAAIAVARAPCAAVSAHDTPAQTPYAAATMPMPAANGPQIGAYFASQS